MVESPPRRIRTILFTEMLVMAILSLIAAFVLAYDAIVLAGNPDTILSCSINEILDCTKVANTWQANVFGFPNAFFGLVSEPVVMTIAVASLCGVRFPKWFMFTANVCYLLGVIFAYWLLYQSTFVIGALCPWCLLVTFATTFVFASMTNWNLREGNLYLPADWQAKGRAFAENGWFTLTIIGWITLIVSIEIIKWGPRFL
ncbi:MAG: vitamin K epoxide reductase family protein [Tetrasphaera sp.]|nr:vitamin K epoxide reductase family protein [Tetrasphaera sp.]